MPARDHVDYYYVRWSAYATISGKRVDIAGFEVVYELDNIPTAVIFPTIGREPRSGREAKAVLTFLQAFPYTPVEIYFRGDTQQDSPKGKAAPGFPYNEDVKVFEGFYQGIGYESMLSPAGGSVRLTGHATGWLAGLYGTSARTNKTTVKGPAGFDEAANLKGKSLTLFSPRTAYQTSPSGAVTNLWLEFIKKFFDRIVKDKKIWGDSDNKSAVAALAKMDDESVFTGKATNELPLPIGEGLLSPEDVGVFLASAIAEEVYVQWRRANLWDALVGLANMFTFHIVPLIETATCAPVYGPLGGEVYTTIDADEYHYNYIGAQTPALISKYVVYGGIGGMSSAFAAQPRVSAIIGIFAADELWTRIGVTINGVTVSEPAPAWLAGEVARGDITRKSLGGKRSAIPDAVNPDSSVEVPEVDYQVIYNNYITSDIGDRYAQSRMQDQLLAHRAGHITGRFRLDVCPGSIVKVQVIEDVSRPTGTPQAIVGMVSRVDLAMAAGGAGSVGSASTKLTLSHVRSDEEQKNSYLVADEHPIFKERFVGAKLWTE